MGAWFSFGAELDAMYVHRDSAIKLKQATQSYVSTFAKFTRNVPFYKYFPTKFLKQANQSVDNMYSIAMSYADQHMDKIMEGVKKGETQYGQSLLEQWLIEGKQTKEKAVRNVTTMFSAGMDTVCHYGLVLVYNDHHTYLFLSIDHQLSFLHAIRALQAP